jgi:xylan 1,4-beta-xylosidase
MAPFVELSFSPVSLSTNNRTIFHYKANISRPQLDKWAALVAEFAAHLIGRYGATVAESLLFEVWNEYNCGFLNATNPRQAYYELYATTAMALKKVSPKLQVGGPATCMSQEVDLFLEYCHKNNLPVDFVSTHIYPTDPSIVNGRIGSTLRATSAQVANSAFPTAPLLYTEFNDGLFGNPAFHDMPFAASWMVKTMASLDGVVPFMSWWTFSDIFEEDGMPSQEFDKPTWTGWGLLSASGIPKPVYRAFQLLHAAGDERVAAKLTNSSLIDNDGDVGVLVLTGKTQGTHIFLFNNHWPDDTSPAAAVTFSLTLDGVSGNVEFNTTRIDNLNANAPQQWRDDGRPPYLSPAQVASYMETSQLRFSPSLCRQVSQSQCVLSVTVPPNGLAILFTE